MTENFRLGRIAGFPLTVNWSVLVLLWLFTFSLAGYSLPHSAPGHSSGAYWLAGFGGALALLGSLLAHELAHAVMARRAGIEVKEITLWLFGGVANLRKEAATPAADFRVAAVGPATSIALAVGFAGGAGWLGTLGSAGLLAGVLWWLAGTNLLLGVFNLIPGAPLDGGRILRALLWWRTGDRTRAAVGAARAGQAVAFSLIGLGLLQFLVGAGLGGLWLVFIGWFLLNAARAEQLESTTRQLLTGLRVDEVMSPDPATVPSWISVDELIERYVLSARHSAYPVLSVDGMVTGLVTLAQLRTVPRAERPATRVGDVAVPLAEVTTAAPETDLLSLMERLSPRTGNRALVLEGRRLVGIVTSTDIARAIAARELAAPPSAEVR